MLLFCITSLLVFTGKSGFLALAFDSGGVTTGPITVPFIMAVGIGLSSIRSDKDASSDSFGLVALCSVGPIMAVLLLGIFSKNDLTYEVQNYTANPHILGEYLHVFGIKAQDVAIALGMIVVFFLIFQVAALHLRKVPFLRIVIGLLVMCALQDAGYRDRPIKFIMISDEELSEGLTGEEGKDFIRNNARGPAAAITLEASNGKKITVIEQTPSVTLHTKDTVPADGIKVDVKNQEI